MLRQWLTRQSLSDVSNDIISIYIFIHDNLFRVQQSTFMGVVNTTVGVGDSILICYEIFHLKKEVPYLTKLR